MQDIQNTTCNTSPPQGVRYAAAMFVFNTFALKIPGSRFRNQKLIIVLKTSKHHLLIWHLSDSIELSGIVSRALNVEPVSMLRNSKLGFVDSNIMVNIKGYPGSGYKSHLYKCRTPTGLSTFSWGWGLPTLACLCKALPNIEQHLPNTTSLNTPSKIRWLRLSGKFLMDLRIPHFNINIMLESNPLKSRIVVRRLAVCYAFMFTWRPVLWYDERCAMICWMLWYWMYTTDDMVCHRIPNVAQRST